MTENVNANYFESDEFNQNSEESDYKNLIAKLQEIRVNIALLEKTIFK